jgi:hypothetical protein
VCGFWVAGQGATTRNGVTARRAGQCLPKEGGTRSGMRGAMKRCCGISYAARSPLRRALHATLRGVPIQGVANKHSHAPPKSCNPPCSELTQKVKVKGPKNCWDHGAKLTNGRSTTGFGIIVSTIDAPGISKIINLSSGSFYKTFIKLSLERHLLQLA